MPSAEHDPGPELYYDEEGDLLWFGNRCLEHSESWLSEDCTVHFAEHPDTLTGITVWLAKETLLPLFSGHSARCEAEDSVTTYDPSADTLRIRNGRPALTRREVFDGCSVFFDAADFPSEVVLEKAAELLMPTLEPKPEPERPRVPTREIHYYPEDDFLSVSNGLPDGGGFDLCRGCIVLFGGYPENPVEFIHWNAAELLLPALTGAATPYQSPYDDEVITYDADTDTLRLQNGLPALVRRDIFEGCGVFFNDKEFVAAIVLEQAAELLIPVLTAEPEGADDPATDCRQ